MSPVQTYANAPIQAAKPDGVTPQTATADPSGAQHALPPTRTTAAPTTIASTGRSSPPPPQPGAVPTPPFIPEPTGSAHPPPPAPAPAGATRGPSTVTATVTKTVNHVWPPKPARAPQPVQTDIPPPATNLASSRSTFTSHSYQYTPRQQNQPVALDLGAVAPPPAAQSSFQPSPSERHSLEHPPGYMQNPYAADGTAAQRERYAEVAREEKEQEGVWGYIRSAGEGLRKAEEGVWKRVLGEG